MTFAHLQMSGWVWASDWTRGAGHTWRNFFYGLRRDCAKQKFFFCGAQNK